MNALLLAVLDEVVALQNGVTLDLVGSGDNAGAVNDGLELGEGQYELFVYICKGWRNEREGWCGWRHRRRGPCSWGAWSWLDRKKNQS